MSLPPDGSTPLIDPTSIVDRVLRDHVIRGYDCSCGAQINSHDRHLVHAAVATTLRMLR